MPKFTIIGQVQDCEADAVEPKGTLAKAWRVRMPSATAYDEAEPPFGAELKEAWAIVAVVRGWPKIPFLQEV